MARPEARRRKLPVSAPVAMRIIFFLLPRAAV
jgi:hypothetical protein